MNSSGCVDELKKLFGCAFLVFVLMLFAGVDKTLASPATIAMQPAQVNNIASGGTFTVNVTVAEVSELYGWQINVTFNPQILNVERVAEGPFLKDINETIFGTNLKNTVGYAIVSAAFMPPYASHGASGSGLLANMTFSVKGSGSTSLHFDATRTYLRTVVSGSVAPILDVTTVDGSFANAAGGFQSGFPLEVIAGIVVVIVVVGVVGFYLWRRRKKTA
jgi:hypothetical protein